jgi:succinate--hydroxymethylglutarate CoA-transferase
MATPICSRSLFQASKSLLRPNGRRLAIYNGRRGLADVANDDMTLPLKGIKVLDMTRVLAGVSIEYPQIL